MTLITQAEFDAAKAKLFTDNEDTLAQQAIIDAATAKLAADKSDASAEQLIIDAYLAQPQPTTLPDLPQAPVGPFVDHGPFTVSANSLVNEGGKMVLRIAKAKFSHQYTAIHHSSTSPNIDLVAFSDIICDDVGSLFYGAVGRMIGAISFDRIQCLNVKSGRPFFMIRGFVGPAFVNDLDLLWNPAPNTHEGDIPGGFQYGAHPDPLKPESLEKLTINRMRVRGIFTNWPVTKYWNGDGGAFEAPCKFLEVNNLTVSDVTDGGLDVKCPLHIGKMHVTRARAGIKAWGGGTIDDFTSIDPRMQGGIGGCSHFRLQGNATKPPVFNFLKVDCVGAAPLFHIENAPVEVHGVGKYDGTQLLVKANGGSLVNSTWNGQAIK